MLSLKENSLAIFPEKDIHALADMLAEPRKIVITTHRNPDGDAMGSSLGLWHVLQALGHETTVITPNAFDHYLGWLPGAAEVIDAYSARRKASRRFKSADLIFTLDFSSLARVGDLAYMVGSAPAPKIMIDHHIEPEDYALLNFHVEGISSTAELVFRLLYQMGHDSLVDRDVAECLYTGLMTDTGSFRFPSTTPDVHLIAASLLDRGINVGAIHNRIYDNFNESRVRFLGYILHEKLRVLPEYHTAYMTMTVKELEEFKIQGGDTEGFVNYNLSLRGINFGVLMKEDKDGSTKMSFRSIGQFPCNEFARHFNGGGHHNASGGRIDIPIDKTEAKFLSLLDEFKDALDY